MKYNIKRPEPTYIRLGDAYLPFASVVRKKDHNGDDSKLYMLCRSSNLIETGSHSLLVVHLGNANIELWPNDTLVEVIEEA